MPKNKGSEKRQTTKVKREPRTGRPQIPVDWRKVDQMLMAQCDGVDIAEALGMSADTLYLACKRDHNVTFTVYAQQKRAKGVAHAKLTFYQEAFVGEPVDKARSTRQIFWLKNHGGMADKQEIKAQVSNEVTVIELPANGTSESDSPSEPWETEPVSSE